MQLLPKFIDLVNSRVTQIVTQANGSLPTEINLKDVEAILFVGLLHLSRSKNQSDLIKIGIPLTNLVFRFVPFNKAELSPAFRKFSLKIFSNALQSNLLDYKRQISQTLGTLVGKVCDDELKIHMYQLKIQIMELEGKKHSSEYRSTLFSLNQTKESLGQPFEQVVDIEENEYLSMDPEEMADLLDQSHQQNLEVIDELLTLVKDLRVTHPFTQADFEIILDVLRSYALNPVS